MAPKTTLTINTSSFSIKLAKYMNSNKTFRNFQDQNFEFKFNFSYGKRKIRYSCRNS